MTRSYFNSLANVWDETIAERDTGKLVSMVERLHIKPGSAVLDIGSGTGVFLPYLMNKIGEDGYLAALDIAEEMLLCCRAKHNDRHIDYLHADVTLLPICPDCFDVIVCYSCFPHFSDKISALAEMYRVLKHRGLVHICHTSSKNEINNVHKQIPAVSNDLIPDEDEMRSMMASVGFKKVKIFNWSDSYLASGVKQ